MSELIALSVLGLDYPTPPTGWAAELDRRGVAIVLDDIGRESIPRAAARGLLTALRENEDRKRRKREEVERAAVEADARFRAGLGRGIPASEVPNGLSAAQLMMLTDPVNQGSRRETMVEHALQNPAGAVTYHRVGPVNEDAP